MRISMLGAALAAAIAGNSGPSFADEGNSRSQAAVVDAKGKFVGVPLSNGLVMRQGKSGSWYKFSLNAKGFLAISYTPTTYFLSTNCAGVGYLTADGDLPASALVSTSPSQPSPHFVTVGTIYYPDGRPQLLTMKSARQLDGTCASFADTPYTTVFAPLATERVSFVGPFGTK